MSEAGGSNSSNSSSFYAEGTLSYLLSKTSSLNLDTRYGVDNNSSATQRGKDSWRTGIGFSQAITQRLHGSLSLNYSYRKVTQTYYLFEDIGFDVDGNESSYGASLSFSYIYSKDLSFNWGVSHYKNSPFIKEDGYKKNLFFIGATYQY